MDVNHTNKWLPSTPGKVNLPVSCDNEVATKPASVADLIPDQESESTSSTTLLSQSCNLNDDKSSFNISTPEKTIPFRPNSYDNVESVRIEHHSLPQLDNVKKKKKKKKKVYCPKVKGQIKRKARCKVSDERKTKKVNSDKRKYQKTSLSKSGKKSKDKLEIQNELLYSLEEHILSKRSSLDSKKKSCKRSLTFESRKNSGSLLHRQDGFIELGCKDDSLLISKKAIPQKRLDLSCPLLIRIRRMKIKTPRKKRSKKIQRKIIQNQRELQVHWKKKRKRTHRCKVALTFQWKKMRRSHHCKGKINLESLAIFNSTSFSHKKVDEKNATQMRKRMKKAKPSNPFGIVPKQEFRKWEIRDRRNSIGIKNGFEKNILDEVSNDENEDNGERKRKIRRKMEMPRKSMKDFIKKFQYLNINSHENQDKLVPFKSSYLNITSHKNQDKKIVPFKSRDYKGKIKLDSETLNEWNLLMHGKSYDETEDSREYWKEERSIFSRRVDAFIDCMQNILGNRSFSPWKGSVLDSVIGVYLTQNVSDLLSSSAYLSLIATFPTKASSNNTPLLKHKNFLEACPINDGFTKGNKKFYSPGMVFGNKKSISKKKKDDQVEQEKRMKEEHEAGEKDKQHWESLRKEYIQKCTPQNCDHTDSADWEAVRCADFNKVAKAIEGRGQNHMIAQRIQALLNKLVEMHGSTNLEWLRHAPPNEVKEYLLKFYGLGLKSVECIRLLALKQVAFPVDVNVARIVVRLGWVPLEPIPGSMEFHELEQYPILDVVQQYLWPRLCTLNQSILYKLHYHLITFGKVFCTKKRPNCKACPMQRGCKHFESANKSSKFAPLQNNVDRKPNDSSERLKITSECLDAFDDPIMTSNVKFATSGSIIEGEPIIEQPVSPRFENNQSEIEDIEDLRTGNNYIGECLISKFGKEDLNSGGNHSELNDIKSSQDLVSYNPNMASKIMGKMKDVARLRTARTVYVLPDNHFLLNEFPKREPDDPLNYLFAMWMKDELEELAAQNQSCCSNNKCFSYNKIDEKDSERISGTILVPCRTATIGRFPLNGTYFQPNEVFAEADSSQHPINISSQFLWNLDTQTAYFGTSTTNIFRSTKEDDITLDKIQECFCNGFLCMREWDRKTGKTRPLLDRLHCKTANQVGKNKKRQRNDQDLKIQSTYYYV